MSRKPAKPYKRLATRGTGPLDKYFGERLRARRTILKLTQLDLGKAVGVSLQQIQKYEIGGNRISAALMVRLAEILDTNVGYFYDEIPKTRPSGKIETPALTKLAGTSHGPRMIEAFLNLKNDKLRGAVADIAELLAQS
jgi:transcriptional regulator with XRE-family HTH domain